MNPKAELECATHGAGYQTFVCEHLVAVPAQAWFSDTPMSRTGGPMPGAPHATFSFWNKGVERQERIEAEDKAPLPSLLRDASLPRTNCKSDALIVGRLPKERRGLCPGDSRGGCHHMARAALIRSAGFQSDRGGRRGWRGPCR